MTGTHALTGGYEIAGRFAVRYTDHQETIATGEAYYLQPGHVSDYLEDTEVFEVSRTAELNKVIEVMWGSKPGRLVLPAARQPVNPCLRR